MTPIFYNTYSSYPTDHYEDQLHTHQFLTPISRSSSSSESLTTHMFLNPPQYQHEGSQAYNDHGIEDNMNNDIHQVKWMSSKMRVMLKMKKPDHPFNLNTYSSTSTEVAKLEEHKLSSSSMEEPDNSSNSTSSNHIPIRVCSDCNTTKTPLWRSGPRGPKSLCNACGIRQRKARRAMAVATAEATEKGNSRIFSDQFTAPLKIRKTQHKDIKKPNKGHATKYKKRQHSKKIITTTTTIPLSPPSPSPSPSPPSSSPVRKNCVEEFLVNLSKNLTLYNVLPQDEKEAAILLMALSCGYAHET